MTAATDDTYGRSSTSTRDADIAAAEETLRGMRSPAVEGKAIQTVLNGLDLFRSMALSNEHELRAQSTAEAWQDISTMPDGEEIILAATDDGRMMFWKASILARNLRGPTPDHLSFPAKIWRPRPALPAKT